METLTETDVKFVTSRLPFDVTALLQRAGPPLFLAGGFIRAMIAREEVNDIDLFGSSRDTLHKAATRLAEKWAGKVHMSANAFTVLAPPRKPAQFITRWLYDDAAALCASFDFTVAQSVIWWTDEGWKSICADGFYPDLAARRLTYTAPARNEDAGGSLLRVRKFLMAGYTIQVKSLAGVVARLSSNVRAKNALAEKNEGALAQVLEELLREVDPSVVRDAVEPMSDEELIATA